MENLTTESPLPKRYLAHATSTRYQQDPVDLMSFLLTQELMQVLHAGRQALRLTLQYPQVTSVTLGCQADVEFYVHQGENEKLDLEDIGYCVCKETVEELGYQAIEVINLETVVVFEPSGFYFEGWSPLGFAYHSAALPYEEFLRLYDSDSDR